MDSINKQVTLTAAYGVSEQAEVVAEVSTADRGGIDKVLSLSAEGKVINVEIMEGQAVVSGKITYKLLYLDETKKLCGLDYFKDFDVKIASDAMTALSCWNVSLGVISTDSTVSGDRVSLTAIADVRLEYYNDVVYDLPETCGDAELCHKEICTSTVQSKSEAMLELSAEDAVPDEIGKVLIFNTEAYIMSVESEGDEKFAVGEACATVLYTVDGGVAQKNFKMPFKEALPASCDCVSVKVKNARVVLTDVEEQGNVITVELSMALACVNYASTCETVPVDAMSPKYELITKTADISAKNLLGQRMFSAQLSVKPSEASASVTAVLPLNVAVADCRLESGVLLLEGVASFSVLDAASEEASATFVEMPFNYAFPCALPQDGASCINARAVFGDVTFVTVGGETEINATLWFNVCICAAKEVSLLTSLQCGGEKAFDDAGISVYFATKGDTLWDIAKTVNVPPSELVKANPFLSEPLEEDRRVLVFRARED